MSADDLDLEAYFARIGYAGPRTATLGTLRELHARHPLSIPFENLSSFLHQPVPLDLPSLQDKLIGQRRGGYCFEQNTLFWRVLSQLGFKVRGLAARVLWNVPSGVRTARGHMLLRVRLPQGDFLADVGFGGLTLTAPLQLEPDRLQHTPREPFRLRRTDGFYTLEAQLAQAWKALYVFELEEHHAEDYDIWNWHTANHPSSRFVTGLLAGRPEADRRHALLNNKYSIYPLHGAPQTRLITRAAELMTLLQEAFAIRLPDAPDLGARLQQLIDAG